MIQQENPKKAVPTIMDLMLNRRRGRCMVGTQRGSFLAGLVDGWLDRLEPEPLFRHAIACAVANALVWDAGAIEPGEAARWSERVVIEPVAGGAVNEQATCPGPRSSSASPP